MPRVIVGFEDLGPVRSHCAGRPNTTQLISIFGGLQQLDERLGGIGPGSFVLNDQRIYRRCSRLRKNANLNPSA
jgi:hypothetical protein